MRTSEQIYHQVRWDPRFDPARFVLGIDLRGRPPKRVALPTFQPGGDIPWHRVLFVEADGVLVWDRASGVDRVDSAGAGLVRQPLRLRPPFFTARTPRRWHPADGWTAADPGTAGVAAAKGQLGSASSPSPFASPTRAGLRVLTWNTLWDRYDADRLHTARRRPLLLTDLARADADIIALQEVEPTLLAMLLAAPWVRADYTVTADPAGRDVADAGLLLLSRLPVLEAGWHPLGRHKAVAAAVVAGSGGPLAVAVTHLSSDHSDDGASRRAAELDKLKDALGPIDCAVIVTGDFNDGSDGPDGPAAKLGFADAWTQVRGADDRSPTFDPVANPLAAVSSLTGRAARLDRVLLRGGGLRATEAVLRGVAGYPEGDGDMLHISDHYGVQVDFESVDGDAWLAGNGLGAIGVLGVSGGHDGHDGPGVVDVPATARTALAWIPPEDVWPSIQAVRERHDPQLDRWPPHVNILFGFVPEADFERAATIVGAALAGVGAPPAGIGAVEPFEAALEGVRTFEHRNGEATVWLDPAAGGAAEWTALREAVAGGFPGCLGRAEGFTPHLTLGKVRGSAAAIRIAPLRAEVKELTLLSRRGDEPMRARAVVELGSGRVRWLDDQGAESTSAAHRPQNPVTVLDRLSQQSDSLAERVIRIVGETLPNATVHVVGSRRMRCDLPGADLDLVASLPRLDVADIRAKLAAALPDPTHLREVIGARVPGLRFRIGALDVDLTLVELIGEPNGTLDGERTDELTDAQAVALSAVTDAEAILASVADQQPSFTRLARLIKAWARARGLDAAPFGGLPGLAWSLLAARSVLESPDPAHFFGTYAARDWHQPIWTPTPPHRDLTAQVAPGFRDLIADELYHAWELLERGTTPALLTPSPMHRRHAAWAVVSIEARPNTAFDETLGRTRGRLRALLTALEATGSTGSTDLHAWPRPFDTGPDLARYAIGLGRTPIDADRLRTIAKDWTRGLSGVSVERRAGGEVPTLS